MNLSITLLIVAVTCVTSYMAFNNATLLSNLLFWPYRIWRNKEWYRTLSCGFVHGDFTHLFFNMFSFYSFGLFIEYSFRAYFGSTGIFIYVLMYFLAIIIADGFNFFKQKDNPNYTALGASGGVSAVIFAAILLQPRGSITLFFIQDVPSFVFGPLYLAYCVYMAKRGGDNIGHTAHFTGAVFGFIFPCLIKPELLKLFFLQLLNT